MARRRRQHHDPLRRVRARGVTQQFDVGSAQGLIEQNGVPGPLRQQACATATSKPGSLTAQRCSRRAISDASML